MLYKEKLRRHGRLDDDADAFAFPFLGYQVCKAAFLLLTGIGSSSLTAARKAAIAGHELRLSPREKGICQLIRNTNKEKLYLDARRWLLHYAETAGGHSPMDIDTYLPKGRKQCYWAMYVHVRRPEPYAALSTFCEAWRTELPWLKIASSLTKMIHCGVCDYLSDQIDNCPRSSADRLSALIHRLGAHYSI